MRISVLSLCLKQKTAYEMRISAWSSEVCSSDLTASAAASGGVAASASLRAPPDRRRRRRRRVPRRYVAPRVAGTGMPAIHHRVALAGRWTARRRGRSARQRDPPPRRENSPAPHVPPPARGRDRSEEHTSELQSLMRTSYTVLCLHKK